jgi:hypothetical protein
LPATWTPRSNRNRAYPSCAPGLDTNRVEVFATMGASVNCRAGSLQLLCKSAGNYAGRQGEQPEAEDGDERAEECVEERAGKNVPIADGCQRGYCPPHRMWDARERIRLRLVFNEVEDLQGPEELSELVLDRLDSLQHDGHDVKENQCDQEDEASLGNAFSPSRSLSANRGPRRQWILSWGCCGYVPCSRKASSAAGCSLRIKLEDDDLSSRSLPDSSSAEYCPGSGMTFYAPLPTMVGGRRSFTGTLPAVMVMPTAIRN